MRVHGYREVGGDVEVLRVYCEAENDFHQRRGRTWLATFARIDGRWREVQPQSRRVAARERAWLDGLTPEEGDRIIAGEDIGRPSPFTGDPSAGFREPGLTYLRGDTPAPDSEQRHIADALTTGRRLSAAGDKPSRPEDLAGRAKLDLGCRCGEPPVRQRGERLWPVLDALLDAKESEVSLSLLRKALRNFR